MICVELVDGCPDCEIEGRYLESIGHTCGVSSPMFSTSCEMFGSMRRMDESFHRLIHEPTLCDGCGAFLSNRLGTDVSVIKMCRSNLCHRWLCPECGWVAMSEGPVDCPSCGSLRRAKVPRRNARVAAMHGNYRLKSGGRR